MFCAFPYLSPLSPILLFFFVCCRHEACLGWRKFGYLPDGSAWFSRVVASIVWFKFICLKECKLRCSITKRKWREKLISWISIARFSRELEKSPGGSVVSNWFNFVQMLPIIKKILSFKELNNMMHFSPKVSLGSYQLFSNYMLAMFNLNNTGLKLFVSFLLFEERDGIFVLVFFQTKFEFLTTCELLASWSQIWKLLCLLFS